MSSSRRQQRKVRTPPAELEDRRPGKPVRIPKMGATPDLAIGRHAITPFSSSALSYPPGTKNGRCSSRRTKLPSIPSLRRVSVTRNGSKPPRNGGRNFLRFFTISWRNRITSVLRGARMAADASQQPLFHAFSDFLEKKNQNFGVEAPGATSWAIAATKA